MLNFNVYHRLKEQKQNIAWNYCIYQTQFGWDLYPNELDEPFFDY